jgi:hypothetical protein
MSTGKTPHRAFMQPRHMVWPVKDAIPASDPEEYDVAIPA